MLPGQVSSDVVFAREKGVTDRAAEPRRLPALEPDVAIAVVAPGIDPSAADARIMAEAISLRFFFFLLLLVRLFQLHCKENPETQFQSAPLSFFFFGLSFVVVISLLLSNALCSFILFLCLIYDCFFVLLFNNVTAISVSPHNVRGSRS